MMIKDSKRKQYNLSPFQFGIAGATAGVITRFLVQPLDVLKIRFQLQITPLALKETKYKSLLQAVGLIVKEEGVSGLWKGHIPAQFLSLVFGAVQFSTYEILSSYVNSKFSHGPKGFEHLVNIGTGTVAGLAAVVLSFPFDVIRTHLIFQSEPKVYKGTLDAINKIYKREGPYGFVKGMSAACMQTAPTSGLVFCFHGIFTNGWLFLFYKRDSMNSNSLTTSGIMFTGFLSGFCAKTLVYPFDLMKKRLQIQGFEQISSKGKEMYKCSKIIDCFLLTVRNEGFLGLFKGFTPSIIKAGVTTSIYFTVYDTTCKFLEYAVR